jgi:hypothetical protein
VLQRKLGVTFIACLIIFAGAAFAADAEAPKPETAADRQKQSRDRTQCAHNLKQLGIGLALFADVPANGTYPDHLSELFDQYVTDKRIFICPSATVHGAGEGNVEQIDYVYIPNNSPEQAMDVLAFCPCKNHQGGGRNVLVGTGSVEWITDDPEAFKKRLMPTLDRLKISLDLPEEKSLTAEQMANLKKAIDELADNDFKVRDAAAMILETAGNAAKSLLEDGTKSGDAERAARCKDLISKIEIRNKKLTLIKALREEFGMDKPAAEKK